MANLLLFFSVKLPVTCFIRLFCAELNLFSIQTEHYPQTLMQFKPLRVYERIVLDDN